MPSYDDIRSLAVFSRLTALDASEAEVLRSDYPGIPEDYVDFLQSVGFGALEDETFSIYSGPVPPGDIYDAVAAAGLESVVLFGDDFQGYSFGFARDRDWAVVEVDPADRSLDLVADSFSAFVRENLIA